MLCGLPSIFNGLTSKSPPSSFEGSKVGNFKELMMVCFPGVRRDSSAIHKMVRFIEGGDYEADEWRCDQGYRVPKSCSGFPFTLEVFENPEASHDDIFLCAGGPKRTKIGGGGEKVVSLGVNYHSLSLVSVYKAIKPKSTRLNDGIWRDVAVGKMLAPLVQENPDDFKGRTYQSRNHSADGCVRVKAIVPYYAKGDLFNRLEDRPLTRAQCLWMASDLARQVAHLHERGVIHTDIKPENVLVTDKGKFALMDFGMAMKKDEYKGIQGTPAYVDPHLLVSKACGVPYPKDIGLLDVYSLGLVMKDAYWGVARKIQHGDFVEEVRNFGPLQLYVEKCLNIGRPRSNDYMIRRFGDLQQKQLQELDGDHGAMQPYVDLMKRMISIDPEQRPDILEVVSSLRQMQFDLVDLDQTKLSAIKV